MFPNERFVNYVLEQALRIAEQSRSEMEKRILSRIEGLYERLQDSPSQFISAVTKVINQEIRSGLAIQKDLFSELDMVGWLSGMNQVMQGLPSSIKNYINKANPRRLTTADNFFQFDKIRIPQLEAAGRNLAEREILPAFAYYSMTDQAQRDSEFTISNLSVEGIGRVRDILAENLSTKPSLDRFMDSMTKEFGRSPLGEGRLENVFRTNWANAVGQGQNAVLEHPMVADAFPFIYTNPTRDDRLTSLCSQFARAGINGTGVFYRSDPIWQKYKFPRHWQCRCTPIPMTPEMAAKAGVKEARKDIWPPQEMTYVEDPYSTIFSQESRDLWDQWVSYQ